MSQLMRLLGLTITGLLPINGFSQYTARVVNFKSSPVVMRPLQGGGPGFTVENKSNRAISQFRFGCIRESKEGRSVPFAFNTPEQIPLEPRGPGSSMTFKSWTPAQAACANRASKVAVIEVLFADGSAWSAPLSFDKVLGPPEPIR